jgi:hypothetical protein
MTIAVRGGIRGYPGGKTPIGGQPGYILDNLPFLPTISDIMIFRP